MSWRHQLTRLAQKGEVFGRALETLSLMRENKGIISTTLGVLRLVSLLAEEVDVDHLSREAKVLWRWKGKGDLALQRTGSGWRPCVEGPIGDFYSDERPEKTVAEVKRQGKATMSCLVVGASGCGKTTWARLALREMHPKGVTLRVPGSFVREPGALAYLQRAKTELDLTGIILDDVSITPHYSSSPFRVDPEMSEPLQLLEQLSGLVSVILTVMEDNVAIRKGRGYNGDFYYSGLRPGRIDSVLFLLPPNDKWRRIILEKNGVPDPNPNLIKRTNGLPGAYLVALAQQLQADGKGWEAKVKTLRLTSPVKPRYIIDQQLDLDFKIRALSRELRQLQKQLGVGKEKAECGKE